MYIDSAGTMPEWLEDAIAAVAVTVVVTVLVVAAISKGGIAGAAIMAVAFSTGTGAGIGAYSAYESGTSIAAGIYGGGIKGAAVGTAIGLGIMTGGGTFSTLGGFAAFGGSLGTNFGAGMLNYTIDNGMNGKSLNWNDAFNNGWKQMASGAFAFGAGILIGAAGFYNVPGQDKMFSGSWFGNLGAGLFLKGVAYYPFDYMLQLM